jgi:hypothetical protein
MTGDKTLFIWAGAGDCPECGRHVSDCECLAAPPLQTVALIAYLALGRGTPDGYVLAWEGEGVGDEVSEYGRYTDDLGCAPPQPERPGLYVFEGEMFYTNDHDTNCGEMEWFGEWRPAVPNDLIRFKLLPVPTEDD